MSTDNMNKKKYVVFDMVKILKEHTDQQHPMKQKTLVEMLHEKGYETDRSTVRRTMTDLVMDPESHICSYTNTAHDEKDTLTDTYYSGLYYDQEFTTAELRWLIDGILFSRNVPHEDRDILIRKLSALGNKYFKWRMENINRLAKDEPMNPQLFTNIEILDQAIIEKKQVRLTYNYMGPDFQLEPHRTRHGTPYRQLINPYSIVARNGYYFLVCNNDYYSDVTNYRIDRMTDIEIVDSPVKPTRQVTGLESGLNIQEYMASNINMAYGRPALITFEANGKGVTEAIDAFGKNISIEKKDDDTFVCTVRTPYYDMERWAMQNWNNITVLTPKDLVERIRSDAETILKRHHS